MKENKPCKDRGLRIAMRHKTETSERMMLPEDFSDRLMRRVGEEVAESEPKSKRRSAWLYTLIGTAAAGILLLLTFRYTHQTVDAGKGAMMAQRTEQREQPQKPELPSGDEKRQSLQTEQQGSPVIAHEEVQAPLMAQETPNMVNTQAVGRRPHTASAVKKASTNISTTDSLDYYIDKIER
ncbi:MAG: hypothetical protein IKS36_02615, partial [Bacteroidales bacterium]|nr:hypothetical protein [Bacteroidales bacterium]